MVSTDTQSLDMMLYAGGDIPKPETNKNHIRLYEHNNCPFSSRARYSFALKKLPFQDVQICLHNKAPWHVEANGGAAPLMELPTGDIIKESGIIMSFANESSTDGVDLVPKDPIAAAKMRLAMEDFGKNCLQTLFPVFGSRGEDDEKIDNFAQNGLKAMEQLCASANGGWLSGCEEPNFMDVHCAPWFEIICMWENSAMHNVIERVDLNGKAPNMVAYFKRWQAHPLIHDVRMRKKIADRHWERTRGWKQGEKCQLSHDVLLDGAFD